MGMQLRFEWHKVIVKQWGQAPFFSLHQKAEGLETCRTYTVKLGGNLILYETATYILTSSSTEGIEVTATVMFPIA